MRFTKKSLQVGDTSEGNLVDGKFKTVYPHFDIIITTDSEEKTTTIRDKMILDQLIADRMYDVATTKQDTLEGRFLAKTITGFIDLSKDDLADMLENTVKEKGLEGTK